MNPQANIVCFRYRPESLAGASDDELSARTVALRQRMLEQGPFYIVQTRPDGAAWLRCTVMNPLTEPADFATMLDRLEELDQSMPAPVSQPKS